MLQLLLVVWVNAVCLAPVRLLLTTRQKTVEMNGKVYKEGDWISLNGSTGDVYDGRVPTTEPELDGDFGAIMNLS